MRTSSRHFPGQGQHQFLRPHFPRQRGALAGPLRGEFAVAVLASCRVQLFCGIVDEPGLDMPPPVAQLGFLESLHSINPAQFAQALAKLQGHAEAAVAVPAPVVAALPAVTPATAPGLLLQDATLKDIVRWLHARNIEPTLRHRLP